MTDTAAGPPSPLALARFLKGWTQAELGTHAGRSEHTVKRIEAGATPQLTTAIALARALGVGVETLFPVTDNALVGNVNDDEAPGQAPRVRTSTAAAGPRGDAILTA